MKITSSEIYYLLPRKHPVSSNLCRSTNTPVKTVRVFSDKSAGDEVLYIIDNSKMLRKASQRLGCAFLICNVALSDLDNIHMESDFAVLTDQIDKYQLLEEIFELFLELQNWDSRLKDAQKLNMPIQQFYQLEQDIISRPSSLIDKNLSVIAYSRDCFEYLSYISSGTLKVPDDNSLLPPDEADDLLMDEEYHSAVNRDGVFIYPSYPSQLKYMCINIFSGSQYLARMTAAFPGTEADANPGEKQLFLHFAEYIREIYSQQTGYVFERHQNDQLHNLVWEILSDTPKTDPADIDAALINYGWNNCHEFSVIKFVFFEGAKWDTVSFYICQQLEKTWAQSCAVFSDRCIVWILNNSLSNMKPSHKLSFDTLGCIVREHACKAGISNTFSNFYDIKSYYRQADVALVIGQKEDPDFWYYKFEDYIYDYLLKRMTTEFTGEQLCHRGLQRIIDYDREKGTEYAKTLYCYLQNRCNATHTADKLFLHRTSLIRRLERIENISNIDFTDQDEILYLELSYKMLDKQDCQA